MAKRPVIKPQQRKTKANTTAKKRAQDVKVYWDRDFASDGYFGKVVKVLGRRGSLLAFSLVLDGAVSKRKLTVDLDDGEYVWAELPSTAPRATKGAPFGLLFLSKAFFKAKKVVVAGGPPKIPKPLSL